MASITFDVPDRHVAALTAKAEKQGITLEDWFQQIAVQEAGPEPTAPPSDFQEWKRRFDVWINAPRPQAPVLTLGAMSRESIYPDRG